jgi:hypothetical protein
MEHQDLQKNNLTDIGERSTDKIAQNKQVAEIAKAFKPIEIACANL